LGTLKAKENVEMANLQKKINTGLDEQSKDRHIEEMKINQKYENHLKDMMSLHDKEKLAFKG